MSFDIQKLLDFIPFLGNKDDLEEDEAPSVLAGFSLDEDEINDVDVEEDEVVDPEEVAALEAENKKKRKKKIMIGAGIVLGVAAAAGVFLYLQNLKNAPVNPLERMAVVSAIPETITMLPNDERLTVLTGEASDITEKVEESEKQEVAAKNQAAMQIKEDGLRKDEVVPLDKSEVTNIEPAAANATKDIVPPSPPAEILNPANSDTDLQEKGGQTAVVNQADEATTNEADLLADVPEQDNQQATNNTDDSPVDKKLKDPLDAAFSQSAAQGLSMMNLAADTDDILAGIDSDLEELAQIEEAEAGAEAEAEAPNNAEDSQADEQQVATTKKQPQLETFEPTLPKLRIPNAPTMTEVENFLTTVATLSYLKPNSSFAPLNHVDQLEELQRKTKEGLVLPAVGEDGRKPWWVYRQMFNAPGHMYRVAVVVTGLGMRRDLMDAAIISLPPEVTLSFSPYTPNLAEVIARSREAGHETLIDLPLEPEEYPRSDPGPLAQISIVPPEENMRRLRKILSTGVAFNGLAGTFGGSYTQNPDNMRPILTELKKSGLLYVDNVGGDGTAPNRDLGVAMKVADVKVGYPYLYDDAIVAQFDFIEKIAVYRGHALMIVEPKPLTFKHLYDWHTRINQPAEQQETTENNIIPVTDRFVLAPVSAVVTE